MKRRFLPLLLSLGAFGCAEQQDQLLPLAPDPAPITRTVPAGGGIVSTTAGASIHFPAGAFSGDQTVSLTTQSVPAALARSGRVISEHAFLVEPAGVRLGAPARAQLRFDAPTGDSTWLAALVAVGPSGVTEYAATRVDATAGIASAQISDLGTLALVIPTADAIFSLSGAQAEPPSNTPSAATAQRLLQADSIRIRCGTPADRCDGLAIRASGNLLERVDRAAIVLPVLDGALRLENGEIRGSVSVKAAFRARLADGRLAENVRIDESFQFRVALPPVGSYPGFSRSAAGAAEGTASIHFPENGNPVATVRHQIQLPGESGTTETASIAISFPFEVYP